MKQIRCTVARILLALSILAVRPGQAGSVVWTNILGGDWSGAANWNPNGGPGSSDTAVLPDVGRSYTVNLDVDATVSGLVVGTNSGVHTQTFTNGLQTLTINGVVEVNSRGVFNLNGGTITGTYGLAGAMTCSLGGYLEGTLTVSNNGVINLAGAYEGDYVALDGTTLTNYGTVNWLNTGNTILYGGSDIPGVNGTVIWNYGLWNAPSDNTFYGSGFLGGTAFNNFGTFLNTGTNTLDANVLFTNTGTLIAQSGTLSLNTCDLTGGTLDFGISSLTNFGVISLAGSPALTGTLSASLIGNYLPMVSNSFPVLTFSSPSSGAFTNASLPPVEIWQTIYNPANVTIQVLSSAVALSLAASPPNIILSWPTNDSAFVLNWTASLAPPIAWTPLTSGITVSGTNNTFTTNTSSANQFFILIAP